MEEHPGIAGGRWTTPDPDAYDARWAALEAAGAAVHGEVDLVAALVGSPPRRVLDAGCGTGRVAIELARRGYAVTGIDLDPAMLDAARRKAPDLDWRLGDLTRLPAPTGPEEHVDAVVLAGNVLIFVGPPGDGAAPAAAVRHLAARLRPGGLLVAGFQLQPHGLSADAHDAHATEAGLEPVGRWATWDRDPWEPGADYVVAVHRRPAP